MGRASGIDYGSHSLKVVEVRWSGKAVALHKATLIPLDPQGNGESLASQVGEKGLRVRGGIYGVSGRDSILRYTHVPPVPPWRMKLIMDYEISEIAAKGGGNISADYQLLNVPRDVSQDLTILVGMAKDQKVSNRIADLQEAGLGSRAACPTSLALYNAYRVLGEELEEAALLVDIGHENMDIAISQAGHLIFARSIQLGGKDFTEAVASSLGVSQAEAEKTKHKIGAIKREGWKNPKEKQVSDALMGVVGNLVSVIQSSVKFCRSQTKISGLKIEKVFLSGGGSRLNGLPEHLARSMNLPVEIFDPVGKLRLGGLSEDARKEVLSHSIELVVPIGLALSSEREKGFQLDLLPTPMKAQRTFRTRTVFLYIAAVVAGIAVLLNIVGAISAIWSEGSRKEVLEQSLEDARQRHDDWKALRDSNERKKSDLEALAWETRPGHFLSVLLDAIGTLTPPTIEISEVGLEPDDEGQSGASRAKWKFKYRIVGESDDSTGRGSLTLRSFERTLDRMPEFASVRIDATRTRRAEAKGVWKFELIVTPSESNPGPVERP
ncbi:MAG: pilus assembly protein PilM [Planctomycetota bacterium]|nr:pilus assembly protein PilM [Planctomycetota bacterium]